MVGIGLVGAAGEHHTACRSDAAFVGDDASDAAVFDREAERARAELDRYAACQQLLDEMGDDADAAGADFLASPLLQNVLRPIVDIGDAAPLEQLLAVDLDRRIARRENGILPFAEIGGRNEIRVEAAALGH